MKANSTREMIDYSRAWRKKGMKGVETLHNVIEVFIDIFDGAFKLWLLSCSELGSSNSVGWLIFRMLWIEK